MVRKRQNTITESVLVPINDGTTLHTTLMTVGTLGRIHHLLNCDLCSKQFDLGRLATTTQFFQHRKRCLDKMQQALAAAEGVATSSVIRLEDLVRYSSSV